MRESLRDKEHLFRVAGLFVVGIALFLVVRGLLVPKDFGKYGHYRPGAIGDIRTQAPAFAGRAACADCHTDIPPVIVAGKHARLGCETCHGAQAKHAEDSDKFKPAKLDARVLCLGCHTQNVAKPKKFPQVDAASHGEGAVCTSCHTPHDPMGDAAADAKNADAGGSK